ncbi:MAG: hypothetical protein ACTHK7_19255 [Aureliella sp.]
MPMCLDGRAWREQLFDRWGIPTLDAFDASLAQALWTTRCSKTKNVERGTPEELYGSSSNQYFYHFARRANVRFAIVSDKYGLHFDDESLAYYDIHPGQLGLDDKRRLGAIVREKAACRGYSQLVYYNASPLMSVPYFEILAESGLKIVYTTRLPSDWP